MKPRPTAFEAVRMILFVTGERMTFAQIYNYSESIKHRYGFITHNTTVRLRYHYRLESRSFPPTITIDRVHLLEKSNENIYFLTKLGKAAAKKDIEKYFPKSSLITWKLVSLKTGKPVKLPKNWGKVL